MSKASNFKKWYEERQGHPPQLTAAYEAIIELEAQAKVVERATRDIAVALEDAGGGDSSSLLTYTNLMTAIINDK
jgi:hypothetical protein